MSISLDIFFDPLNWIFSSCLSEPNIVKVGDYTVTSKGGGFAGHIHKPLDIDHDDSSFVGNLHYFINTVRNELY